VEQLLVRLGRRVGLLLVGEPDVVAGVDDLGLDLGVLAEPK
jgi:hypothetical protein